MICAWLICAEQTSFSQDLVFQSKRIEFEEGLASRSINCFFEDSRGFMWFGTNEGLNKYDAHRLDLYDENRGLASNYISQIAEDASGRLWLLGDDPNFPGQKVLQVFDPVNERATLISDLIPDLPFDLTQVIHINSDFDAANLWITVEYQGVFHYWEGNFRKVWKPENELAGVRIQRTISGQDCLWLLVNHSVVKIDQDTIQITQKQETEYFGQPPVAASKDGDIIFAVDFRRTNTPNQTDSLFLDLNNERLRTGKKNFLLGRRLLGLDPFQKLIWTDSAAQVYVHDFDLNLHAKFPMETPLFVPPKFLTFTPNGIGWLNVDDGVLMVYLDNQKFKNYLTGIRIFDQNGYSARGIYVEGDTMYSNGLEYSYKTHLDTRQYEPFGPTTGFYGKLWDQEAFKRLALLTDSQGNLWYTDEAFRVARYDRTQKKFTDFSYRKSALDSFRIRGIDYSVHWAAHFDKNETLWLGRRAGLAFKKPGATYLENFENYGEYPELRQTGVYDFYENNDGIWIAAETGVYLMSLEGELIRRYSQNGERKLPYNNLVHIREDKDGELWLASRGGGIIKLNTETGAFRQWTTRQGLSDNIVYATYEDDFGFIWASSNRGIMRIRKSDFQVSTFLEGDGLNTEEFNTTSHFQAGDGRIFFGNIDGITAFQPANFMDNAENKSIHLSQLEIQNRSDGLYANASQKLLETNSITLSPNELGFNLQFSLLDFKGADYNNYSYLIEDLDGDWNYIDEPEIRINALPYGNFTLKVRGQSLRGQWSEVLSIPVRVIKPFYLRWWFLTSLLLVIAAIVWLWVKAHIKNLKKQQEKLEIEVEKRTEQIRQQAEELKSMDRLKSRFFANVSHELRTPLTLILGPISSLIKNDIPEKIRHDLLRVERNANSMSNLVEEILDLSKLEANQLSINAEPTLVSEYFEVLFTNFLSQARLKDIRYNYQFTGNKQASVQLDQRIVNRIITNLLSNAFKFTPSEGEIHLRVKLNPDSIEVEVSDTGVGISKTDLPHIFERFFQTKDTTKAVQGGTGIGLAMSKELAQLLGGSLNVVSQENEGTTFVFTLPCEVSKTTEPKTIKPEKEPVIEESVIEELNEWIGKSNLLIVEDNLDMQAYLQEVLSDFSSIDVAHHGKDGLRKLKGDKLPDIIISDMMMPEMDGLEFLETIRKDQNTYDIPLLMLTARSAEEDKMKAFTLGVDDYLLKPFSVDELKARLKNLLKNAEVRKKARLNEETDETPALPEERNSWLTQINEVIEKHVHEVDFNIATVAEKIGLSERQFQRNLKKATGLTPVVYLKEIRLQMARNYLEGKSFTQVSSVSEAVGFTSTAYFSKLFKERFGKLPSDYLN